MGHPENQTAAKGRPPANPEFISNSLDFLESFVPDGGPFSPTVGGALGAYISAVNDYLGHILEQTREGVPH